MKALDLKEAIVNIDNGRFANIIETFEIKDVCAQCDHFNLSINDEREGYRCKGSPDCIPATLHPDVVKLFNKKLGWIE